ncbi:MAG: SH3 domain-containing protein [Calothrix sp. C42_A2020_038]|nr:SH3 domain-containing protein [Calothrix sp. C42_A2020_038]
MVLNLFKYLLGFVLAIAILVGSGVATTLYFINQTSRIPPKPIYANDDPKVRASAGLSTRPQDSKTPSAAKSPVAKEDKVVSVTVPKPTPSITAEATPKPTITDEPPKLPPGAYNARVTWSQGLSLRSQPNTDAERVGGVGFNEKVIVIEESQDKVWQKVRIESTNQEGWVKAGNTKKDE